MLLHIKIVCPNGIAAFSQDLTTMYCPLYSGDLYFGRKVRHKLQAYNVWLDREIYYRAFSHVKFILTLFRWKKTK